MQTPTTSTSTPDAEPSPDTPQALQQVAMPDRVTPDVPHLTEAWQRARMSYGLFAGLLLAWELIGIKLGKAPFGSVDATLEAPEAAPIVLMALTGYFGARATIEWFQCDAKRRELLASRVDWYLSHALAATAASTYGMQRLLELNIGAALAAADSRIVGLVLSAVTGLGAGAYAARCYLYYPPRLSGYRQYLASVLSLGLAITLVVAGLLMERLMLALIYMATLGASTLVCYGWSVWWRAPSRIETLSRATEYNEERLRAIHETIGARDSADTANDAYERLLREEHAYLTVNLRENQILTNRLKSWLWRPR